MTRSPTIRPIRAGDEISVEVEGGFVRRRAPCDGLSIETPDRDVFVPVDDVIATLKLMGKLPRR